MTTEPTAEVSEIEEHEMTPFESQLAQAILGALEHRGFYDCGKYLDTSLIEHIRPILHSHTTALKAKVETTIGMHNAKILNYFQQAGTPDMPMVAYDERLCLIPAIEKATKETMAELITNIT